MPLPKDTRGWRDNNWKGLVFVRLCGVNIIGYIALDVTYSDPSARPNHLDPAETHLVVEATLQQMPCNAT